MTDQELELRLRAWYRADIGDGRTGADGAVVRPSSHRRGVDTVRFPSR